MFFSVAQMCLTLCDPMDCSMPGFPEYWDMFLNKCGYDIHHFNAQFLLYFFLMTYYLLILDYGNNIRQKANLSAFLLFEF